MSASTQRVKRDLERAFPDHTVIRSKRGRLKIYDQAGCMLASMPSTPSEPHWMVNARVEIARHVCPHKPAPAPAI